MNQTRPIPQLPLNEKVTFASAFEALYLKAISAQLTTSFKAEMKALGVNLEKLDTAYPYTVWLRGLELAAKTIFPEQKKQAAYTHMGQRLVESYFETLIGKPLLTVVRLLGPHRTLMRMKKNFRSTNNYSETDFFEHGPGDYELWINEPGDSRFVTLGILQRGLQIAGAPDVKVDISSTDDEGTRYRVKT